MIGLEGVQNFPLPKAEGFRDSRDLRFVSKPAISLAKPTVEFKFKRGKWPRLQISSNETSSAQDSQIFRIHIFLNFEILFFEAYHFQNSEGL